jgi:hypothetical protein
MLENKDIELFASLLKEKENKTEEEIKVLEKLELIVEFNSVKDEMDSKLYAVQDKLRKLYEENK